MSSATKNPSWRGQSYHPTAKPTSLGKRRWIATVLLCLMSIALALVFWQVFSSRKAQTHIFAVVVNQGQKQSGQLDNLSIAPLRFTSSFPKAISGLGLASNLHVTEELQLDSVRIQERLSTISKSAQRQDTLICSIQAQCMTIDGEARLIDADFSLQDSSPDSRQSASGGIPLPKLLKLFDIFPGTIVLALDAGDVVADTAAHCEQNDFLVKLQQVAMENKNDRLWILTSHSPGEISQDDLLGRERLFGRALAEALLGGVRVPKSEEFLRQWSRDRLLSLDEIANYVYRRVYSDSGKSQSPWLIRSGQGFVRSDKAGWADARLVYLAKLDKQGRMLGLAPPNVAQSEKKSDAVTIPSTQERSTSDNWIVKWQEFEKTWNRKSSDASYAWSLAECFPLVYRKMRAQLVDAELRSRAGLSDSLTRSFSNPIEPNPPDLQRMRELFESNPSQKRWDASELIDKQEQVHLLQHICQACLHVAEIRQLITRLDVLGEKSRPILNRLVDSFDHRLSPTELRARLKSDLRDFPGAIDILIEDTLGDPKTAVLESLLLCGSITAVQREKVLNKKLARKSLEGEYPTSIPESPSSWSKPSKSTASSVSSPAQTNASGEDMKSLQGTIANLINQGLRDDRLVARADQSLSLNSPLASLPSLPERKHGWWHDWHQKGTPLAQPLRLEASARFSLSLKLDPFPRPSEIRIQRSLFPDGLIGLKLDGERIDDANPTFVRKWSQIEQNGQTIEVELETSEIVRPSAETIALKISGVNGPTNEPLPLRLRLTSKDRIELNVNRFIRKDGKDEWWPEEASLKGRVFRLHPFAGHETYFSLEAINRGEKAKTIQADLYPLPKRIGVPGILVSNDAYIQSDFNEDDTVRQVKKSAAIATAKGLELKPQQAKKMVLLPAAVAAVPATELPKPTLVPASPDVSAGMVLILTDVNDGAVLESFLFEYDPSKPSEYIEAYVAVEANEQSRVISVQAQYRDANEDGQPDLSPTDNQVIDVSIFREPWMGANPKGEFNGVIDPSRKLPLRLSLQVPLDATLENLTFLSLNISGYPRALSKNISIRDLQKQVLESFKGDKPKAAIRSISDGTKTYWSVLPNEYKPDADLPIGSKSLAIFKQPKQVEVIIAFDWARDVSNGQMQSAFLRLGDSEKKIFGDRNWVFQATKLTEDGIGITANVSDHSVVMDSSGMQNKTLQLRTIALERESDAIEVVFDSQLPQLRVIKLMKEDVFKGEETSVQFEIQENGLSGISRFEMLVHNGLNEEKVKLPGTLNQNESERGSRSIERNLPIGKLESGSYKVFITASDLAGNGPVKSNAVPLRIREKPAPPQADGKPPPTKVSPPVLGSIRGKVRFANGDEPSQAKVSLDSNGKSGDFPNGNFSFSEVPLGKYKITAEFAYQSSTWGGEATGVFKTEADFQKEFEIRCKKAP